MICRLKLYNDSQEKERFRPRGSWNYNYGILPESEAEPEICKTDHGKETLTGGGRTWQI